MPGTHIEHRMEIDSKPINSLDKVAKKHDIAYLNAGKTYDRRINLGFPYSNSAKHFFEQEVWKADDEFKDEIKKVASDDPIIAKIAEKAIATKEALEKKHILPTKVFSGRAKKPQLPPFVRQAKIHLSKQTLLTNKKR